jgi:hypothetical protein
MPELGRPTATEYMDDVVKEAFEIRPNPYRDERFNLSHLLNP